jgi:TRAP-type mannitol/chloroaromatic compound transport system substrate-binding protein
MQAKYDAENPAALRRLLSAGAKLQPFSPAILDASLKASLDVCREIAAGNADFKKALDATVAFRGEQYLWWQVAEFSYDGFMIRNRTRL